MKTDPVCPRIILESRIGFHFQEIKDSRIIQHPCKFKEKSEHFFAKFDLDGRPKKIRFLAVSGQSESIFWPGSGSSFFGEI